MKRRIRFIMFSIVIFISVTGYARYIEPNLLKVRTFDVVTEKPIKPISIIFFTDTHFGKYYDVHNAEKIVKKINQSNADLVIFGGDLLDNYARDTIDFEYLKEQFENIDVTIGKYAVRGNHDYGGGAVRVYEDFMTSCGFQLLDNEHIVFDDYGIQLIGYDDYLMGWTDPTLYKIQSNLFNVIIAHEPIVSQFIESESDNLMLSGHTHGGQVNIPFLTEKLLPEGSGQFVKGFYTEKEIGTTASLNMYTSSGIGMTRYPFRFLNIPEIIKINIKNAN